MWRCCDIDVTLLYLRLSSPKLCPCNHVAPWWASLQILSSAQGYFNFSCPLHPPLKRPQPQHTWIYEVLYMEPGGMAITSFHLAYFEFSDVTYVQCFLKTPKTGIWWLYPTPVYYHHPHPSLPLIPRPIPPIPTPSRWNKSLGFVHRCHTNSIFSKSLDWNTWKCVRGGFHGNVPGTLLTNMYVFGVPSVNNILVWVFTHCHTQVWIPNSDTCGWLTE